MRYSIKWLLIATITYLCRSETIHFTNSPSHLIGSKNFTSYKLFVKHSDPITIIEANKEINESPSTNVYENDRIDLDENDRDDIDVSTYDGSFGEKTLLVANGGSHQRERTPTQEVREAIGLTIDSEPFDDDPSTRFNDHDSDAAGTSGGVKKLVYSPVLLKKFVKEYTEKLKHADPGTKNAIKEIGEKINKNTNGDNGDHEPSDFDKHNENIEEKYNLNSFHNDGYAGDRRRRPSAGNNPINSPYKDRDGWVTLEAVPWSSSTVSKWQGYGNKHNDDRRPGSFASHDRPHSRPEKQPYNEHDDDFYNQPKPFNDDRPGTYSTWTRPQSLKRPGSQYAFSAFSDGNQEHSDDYNERPSNNKRPWSDDIITDHRPSNFPRQPPKRADVYSDENDDRHRPSSHHSHPAEGNGEWVLISTTKGYQSPANRRQHGKRAMSFHETAASLNSPQITSHKAIKLTVLPALNIDNKNSTFSTDKNKNVKPAMVTSHGGLLEVESSFQTVDEAVAESGNKHQLAIDASATNTQVKNSNKNKNTLNQSKKHKVLKGN